MPKKYLCQFFATMDLLRLQKNREGQWFRINRKWEITYYDRSEFFIIA